VTWLHQGGRTSREGAQSWEGGEGGEPPEAIFSELSEIYSDFTSDVTVDATQAPAVPMSSDSEHEFAGRGRAQARKQQPRGPLQWEAANVEVEEEGTGSLDGLPPGRDALGAEQFRSSECRLSGTPGAGRDPRGVACAGPTAEGRGTRVRRQAQGRYPALVHQQAAKRGSSRCTGEWQGACSSEPPLRLGGGSQGEKGEKGADTGGSRGWGERARRGVKGGRTGGT